jgi:hypothetical protein
MFGDRLDYRLSVDQEVSRDGTLRRCAAPAERPAGPFPAVFADVKAETLRAAWLMVGRISSVLRHRQ